MTSTIQRKLDFKVRKSSRLSKKSNLENEVDTITLQRRERRTCRKKKEECLSPRKRSGSESEACSPVKVVPNCSPSKKKKDIVQISSRETPSKTSLIDKLSKLTPLSPRKDNNNIENMVMSKVKSPIKDIGIKIKTLSPEKREVLLNSPVKENISVVLKKRQSPTKRRLLLEESPIRSIKSPVKCQPFELSPVKSNRCLQSPVKCKPLDLSSTKSTPVINSDISTPKSCKSINPAYNLAKQSLHTAKPERLVCREKEVGEITEFLETHLINMSAGSLYISGAPGTGKTAALLHIIDDLKTDHKCKICYLNCMMVKDSATVFKKLYQEITGKTLTSKKDPTKNMEKCLTTGKCSIILVLDEIDQLDSKSQEVLYTIFEWPTLPNSKLILIGIANALDLTDRILPRLQAQPKCKPQLLNFAPYSREQIATVIQDRLKKLESDGVCVIEPSAIQFCARKVSAVAGDMRKALDVCRRAVEVVESEIRQQKLKSIVSSSPQKCTIKKIGVMQISKVVSEVYGTGIQSSDQKEETVPLQQKLVTCSLLLMIKSGKNKEVPMGKLHETYRKLCQKRQMAAVDQSEFFSLCELLESRGIMGVKKAKETRLSKVNLKLDEKELEHALQDKVLISTILQQGL